MLGPLHTAAQGAYLGDKFWGNRTATFSGNFAAVKRYSEMCTACPAGEARVKTGNIVAGLFPSRGKRHRIGKERANHRHEASPYEMCRPTLGKQGRDFTANKKANSEELAYISI